MEDSLATILCTIEPFKVTQEELEMKDHVCIPLNWKQLVFQRGCSFDLISYIIEEESPGTRCSRSSRRLVSRCLTDIGAEAHLAIIEEQCEKWEVALFHPFPIVCWVRRFLKICSHVQIEQWQQKG